MPQMHDCAFSVATCMSAAAQVCCGSTAQVLFRSLDVIYPPGGSLHMSLISIVSLQVGSLNLLQLQLCFMGQLGSQSGSSHQMAMTEQGYSLLDKVVCEETQH